MLVLTRKIGESLLIQTSTGEEIKIIVLSVKGNQVRIGAEAERDVYVFREEMLEHICEVDISRHTNT